MAVLPATRRLHLGTLRQQFKRDHEPLIHLRTEDVPELMRECRHGDFSAPPQPGLPKACLCGARPVCNG